MSFFEFDENLKQAAKTAETASAEAFARINECTEYKQQKEVNAIRKNGVSESHFAASTGYGYDDRGRETLEKVFADCMDAEASIFRHSLASGTHTLTVALFGLLRPGDTMLCLTGRPYDTLIGVLGIDGESSGSLADFGIKYEQVELCADGRPDNAAIAERLKHKKYAVN